MTAQTVNEFIDNLELQCGPDLRERLGDAGWEYAKELHARVKMQEDTMLLMAEDIRTYSRSSKPAAAIQEDYVMKALGYVAAETPYPAGLMGRKAFAQITETLASPDEQDQEESEASE